ncbi:lactoylglutathione lyase [Gracilibacillus halophilus YIM-C55.5]|uniref:Lactoylglutathione lyase n=2 Tax=Gracilibacillus TaxID=74385 RepID=N4WIS7_9BACI|nr:lactoylglutathione lyase [Gracilibacillus halophilus YIM-C55.5]
MFGHQIAYRNVVSKYYHFRPEEMEQAFEDFVSILEENGYHPTGDMFFSILSDPTADEMTVEIFLPIEEDSIRKDIDEQVFFRSYFSIKPMVMTRVTENFDEQSQVKYWELVEYLQKNDLEQRTPIFVVYKKTQSGRTYVEMSVGVYI